MNRLPILISIILLTLNMSCNDNSKKTKQQTKVLKQQQRQTDTCSSSIDSIKVSFSNEPVHHFLFPNYNKFIKFNRSSKKIRYIPAYEKYMLDGGLIDTIIITCEHLIKIENEFKNLTPNKVDIRIDVDTNLGAIFYYKTGKQDTICFDSYNTEGMNMNGVFLEENPKFKFLLKYYAGFYSWISKEELKKMPELNDTTFTRDSIKITLENNPNAIFEKRK